MMRSTDTWHGRPYLIGDSRGRGQHALRAAGVQHHGRRAAGARQTPLERRDDAAALAEAAVLGRQHQLDAEVAEEIQIEELGAAARAVEQRRSSRRARAATSASVANGARPTPPATIHASAGGSTMVNGRPSGPRQATRWPGARVVEQRGRGADPLVEDREAGRRARARRAGPRTRKTAGAAADRGRRRP